MIANMASETSGQINTYNASIKVCMCFPFVWLVRNGAPADGVTSAEQGLGLGSWLGRVIVDDVLVDL